MKAMVSAQILANNGVAMDDEALKKEQARIDKETGLPEFLARIKAVFKGDMAAYRKVYVLPVYAGRMIYFDFFLHNKAIHAESERAAQDFINKVKSDPKSFDKLMKELNLKSSFFTISAYDGFDYEMPGDKDPRRAGPKGMKIITPEKNAALKARFEADQKRQQSDEAVRWINEVIKPLKPGDVYNKVIDRSESWQVVRYIGPVKGEKDKYKLEGIHFPKADYGKWTEEQMKKVEIWQKNPPKPTTTPTSKS
jgi:hypothetical protein